MFASKMCAGAIGSWCATHDSTQVTISGSYGGTLDFKNLAKPLSFEGTRDTQVPQARITSHPASPLTIAR